MRTFLTGGFMFLLLPITSFAKGNGQVDYWFVYDPKVVSEESSVTGDLGGTLQDGEKLRSLLQTSRCHVSGSIDRSANMCNLTSSCSTTYSRACRRYDAASQKLVDCDENHPGNTEDSQIKPRQTSSTTQCSADLCGSSLSQSQKKSGSIDLFDKCKSETVDAVAGLQSLASHGSMSQNTAQSATTDLKIEDTSKADAIVGGQYSEFLRIYCGSPGSENSAECGHAGSAK